MRRVVMEIIWHMNEREESGEAHGRPEQQQLSHPFSQVFACFPPQQEAVEEGVKDAVQEEEDEEKEEGEDGGDDREEIERKIHALQRIVPGGESLGVDKLFDETAGYILALQYQVKALRALTGFFEKLEKEKTKFGG
ncbi:hypothetical protein glysoja_019931 [Glycine soja]|nr:hypothetical protein glysoja_019931 [Glycine soja]